MSVSDLPYPHFVPYHHFPTNCQGFPSSSSLSSPSSSSDLPYPARPIFSSLSALAHDVSSQLPNNSLRYSRLNPAFTMNTLSTEEMERFQKLSNEFEADVQVLICSRCLVLHYRKISPADAPSVITGPARIDKTIDPGDCYGICKCGSDSGHQD